MSLRRIRAVANIPIRRKTDREVDLNNVKIDIKTENNLAGTTEINDQKLPTSEKLHRELTNDKLELKESDVNTSLKCDLDQNKKSAHVSDSSTINSNSDISKPTFSRSRIKISAKIPIRNKNVDSEKQDLEADISAKKNNLELDSKIHAKNDEIIVDNQTDLSTRTLETKSNSITNLKPLDKYVSKQDEVIDSDHIPEKHIFPKSEHQSVVSLGSPNKVLQEPESIILHIDDISRTTNRTKTLESTANNTIVVGSRDIKNLAPPQSPSKLIPRRYRPTPRTDRRSSVAGSASESEDDTKRSHVSRIGSDSTTTSVLNSGQENVIPDNKIEVYSTFKKKKTWSDMARKMAEARREFQSKFGNKLPDRQKLTMMDLIFYNPPNNPMVRREVLKGNVKQETKLSVKEESQKEEETVDDPVEEEENSLPAPRVKVGPNGEIILDEQSLVIETSDMKKAREFTPTTVVVDDLNDEYGVYKRSKRTKGWTESETVSFYRVLQITGTDFSMMLGFFRDRSRRDLKLKFKKEERLNRRLIDKVLLNPRTFDLDECRRLLEKDREEATLKKELAKKKEETRKLEARALKRTRRSNENETGKRKKRLSWFGRQIVEDEVIEPPKNRIKHLKRKRQYSTNPQTESELDHFRKKCGIEPRNSTLKVEKSNASYTSISSDVSNDCESQPSLVEEPQSIFVEKSKPLNKTQTDEVNVTAALTIADVEPGSVFVRLCESPTSGRKVKQAYTVFSDDPSKSILLSQDQMSLLDSYLDGNDLVSLDLPVVNGTLMDDGTYIVNEH